MWHVPESNVRITLEMDVGSLLASDSRVGRLYFGTSPTFAREIRLNGQTDATRNADSADTGTAYSRRLLHIAMQKDVRRGARSTMQTLKRVV